MLLSPEQCQPSDKTSGWLPMLNKGHYGKKTKKQKKQKTKQNKKKPTHL